MAVGRISGPLLKDNLLRNGVNLAFETNLLYLDVNNGRIGIKTSSPAYDLDVNGTTRTTNLTATTQANLATFTISGNNIASSSNTINFLPSGAGNTIYNARAIVGNLQLTGNTISATNSNGAINITANGTGGINLGNTSGSVLVTVTGNLHATGNITADGNITLGDNLTQDTVSFAAEINSDIIPSTNNTRNLGSDPNAGGNAWANAYIRNVISTNITSSTATINGINVILPQGNIYYVATAGSDSNAGVHENNPFLTIAKALSVATLGSTVYVYPGAYTEIFPLTIPVGVTLKGAGLRAVTVQPTVGTKSNDAVLLNGETTIEDLTIAGFLFNSGANTGYGFRFASNFLVTSRSPYIRNVSVITRGSVVNAGDPYGFDQNDAGKGAFADGSVANAASKEASMLFQNVTFFTPNQECIVATNGVRIEWLNSFTYFADKGFYVYSSSTGFAGAGQTRLRIDNKTGTWAVGNTIRYYDTDGVTELASGVVASLTGNYVNLTGRCLGFKTITDRIAHPIYTQGNAKLSTAQKKFGTASLLLDGVGDFVSHPTDPDFAFPSTALRLAKTITASGNAVVSTAQSKFGGASVAFDGTVDYLSVASNTDFAFGTGDFTIEMWVYRVGTAANQTLVDFRTTSSSLISPVIYLDAGYAPIFYVGGTNVITSVAAVALTTWTHIAVSRTSGSTRLFINGAQSGNTYTDSNSYIQGPVTLGSIVGGLSYFNGYVDEFRVTKGLARYTGNFTPSTTAFTDDATSKLLIHGDSAIVDDAGNTTDFTIEGWIYPTAGGAYQSLFDFRSTAIETAMFLGINTSNQIYLYVNGVITITTAATIPLSAWTHVALVRRNASTKIYLNGTQSGSAWADITNYGTTKPLRIGADYSGAYGFTGYIDDVRISKGVARYTTTFTAPTEQLTGDLNTVLLLHFDGADAATTVVDNGVTLQDIRNITTGGAASIINFADYSDFGVEVRSIGSASVYGNYGAYGDGIGVIVYLISQNFAYVGSGKLSTNDPGDRIHANEVVALNNAKIYYTSVNNDGTFDVGNLFSVNQKTGDVTFNGVTTNITASSGVVFSDGVNTTTLLPGEIDTGNIRISGNTVQSITGPVNITAANGVINLQNNTYVTGDLGITGNFTVGGNIIIGDQTTDTINFVAGISSNLIPATTSTYDLGTSSLTWANSYFTSANLGNITVSGNTISTTTGDLNLQANSTSNVQIRNLAVYNNVISSVNTNANIVLTPQGTGNVVINNNQSFIVPVGSTGQQPATPTNGMVRYNTTNNRYEGYANGYWTNLGGVQSLDGRTYIIPESSPGANDNVISFYANNVNSAYINSSGLYATDFKTANIDITGNTISTYTANTDINLVPNGTGSIAIGNLAFNNNAITNRVSQAVTVLAASGAGYYKFGGTYGVGIPFGNGNTDRPGNIYAETGMIRLNTDSLSVEVFNGAAWSSVVGNAGGITNIQATDIALGIVLSLG